MSIPDLHYTYDETLPTARDRIRNLLGDIGPTVWYRADETYDSLLILYSEPAVAAMLARALSAQFRSELQSASVPGGPSVSWGDQTKAWLALAASLEKSIADNPLPGAGEFIDGIAVRPGMNDGITRYGEYRAQPPYERLEEDWW